MSFSLTPFTSNCKWQGAYKIHQEDANNVQDRVASRAMTADACLEEEERTSEHLRTRKREAI